MKMGVQPYLVAACAGALLVCASPSQADPAPTAAPSANVQVGSPPACTVPDKPVTVKRAVVPDTPPMAAQQGIYGTVRVLVDLDETGAVTGAKVMSSPSVLLNAASLAAARKSTYEPAMKACNAVSSRYLFTVEFSSHQFR